MLTGIRSNDEPVYLVESKETMSANTRRYADMIFYLPEQLEPQESDQILSHNRDLLENCHHLEPNPQDSLQSGFLSAPAFESKFACGGERLTGSPPPTTITLFAFASA